MPGKMGRIVSPRRNPPSRREGAATQGASGLNLFTPQTGRRHMEYDQIPHEHNSPANRALVIGGDESMQKLLQRTLRTADWEVTLQDYGAGGFSSENHWPLVFMCLEREREEAMEILKRMQPAILAEHTHAFIIAQRPSVGDAMAYLQGGATDYLAWPMLPSQIVEIADRMRKIAGYQRLYTEAPVIEASSDHEGKRPMIGNSAKMVELSKQVTKVASTPGMRVFITGETGTGKEIVARQIHEVSGCRGAFRAVNCAAAVETLLESELFGHEKGAFTGAHTMKKGLWEEAADGTLFLDEITETSLSVQAKLLRALQEGVIRRVGANQEIKVTARVIAASNKNIEKAVAEGTFREDLYYRLGQVLHLPPLRQRREDIPLLVEHFLRRASTTKVITPEALDALSAYDWPGNVRQLETVIQLLTVFAGRFVFREDVARHIQMEKTREEFEREVLLALWSTVPRVKPGEWPTINQLRNWYVQNAYQILGKQSVVAKQLGLDVRTVNTILQKEESMADASEQDEISDAGDEG